MKRRLASGEMPLRLLHVTETTVSGIRQHVHNLAFGLDTRVFAVDVACPSAGRHVFGDDYFAEELQERGIGVHSVPMRREPHPASDARALACLVRLARHYDIVHTHSSKAGFLGRLAGRLAGVPVVIHTPNAFAFLGPHRTGATHLFYALERLAARFTDVLIACSPSEAQAAARLLPTERIRVIPNAVDLSQFGGRGTGVGGRGSDLPLTNSGGSVLASVPGSDPRPPTPDPRPPVLGMVARLAPQKAPEVFVRAAGHVVRARPDARFWLIGDGELRSSLEALARQVGAAGAIEFLGHRRDVPELLRAMDVFVLTSRYEGMPYSLLEAMACALPVVATRAPGTTDLVLDGVTGLLTAVDAPEEIATAILTLLDSPRRALRMGQAGRQRVAEHFSLPAMLAAHEALYRDMAARAQRSPATGRPRHARGWGS